MLNRYKHYNLQTKGMHGLPRLVVYTSADAHYSIKKLCAFEGIGSDNLYLVNTDSKGKMDVSHLRQQIQRTIEEKAIPIMVSATAGEFGYFFLMIITITTILSLYVYIIIIIKTANHL